MTLQETLNLHVTNAVSSLYDATLESVEFQATRKEFEGDITKNTNINIILYLLYSYIIFPNPIHYTYSNSIPPHQNPTQYMPTFETFGAFFPYETFSEITEVVQKTGPWHRQNYSYWVFSVSRRPHPTENGAKDAILELISEFT